MVGGAFVVGAVVGAVVMLWSVRRFIRSEKFGDELVDGLLGDGWGLP